MNPHVRKLIELQAVDLRLAEVRGRMAAFPARLNVVEASVAAARQGLAQAKAGIQAAHRDRKKYELDVEQWKEKARKYKDQTYEVKTNEAYKALQHEIQMAEAEVAKSEDRLLEQMVASEEYDRRIKAAEKVLAEAEAAAAAEREKIKAEQALADQELAALGAERERAVNGVPEDLLDHYQRIARRHSGIALAAVRDEACALCGVRVRPHVFQELRRAECEEIFHCETCTRILYSVEPAAAPAPAPADATASHEA
jgi:predicted  nucleic acid-binding Zn-ribbon protein